MKFSRKELEELLVKAQNATLGIWKWEDSYNSREHLEHKKLGLDSECENIKAGRIVLKSDKKTILKEWSAYAQDSGIEVSTTDAKFIETANPEVVKALIESVIGLSETLESVAGNGSNVRRVYLDEGFWEISAQQKALAKEALEKWGVGE